MRHCALGAILFLAFTASLTFAQTGVEAKPATAAAAQEFVDRANADLLKLGVDASHADWTAKTFITEDTEATSALLNQQSTARSLALIEESHRFDRLTLPPELKRQIKLLQVNAPALGAVIWAMRNPRAGIVEPDDLDYKTVLDIAMPYLGPVVGVYSDWSPLVGRGELYPEDVDRDDPWQFKNFRVV